MATYDTIRHDRLIEDLACQLAPIRRLSPPVWRALGWIALPALIGAGLWPFVDRASLLERLAVADLRMSYLGAAATALAAALAAFQTSIPGRSHAWALLPLPPALLWLGASGIGCLRDWGLADAEPTNLPEVSGCFGFIIGLSLPLSLGLLAMLRRAFPLNPTLTASLAGLAAAAGAATLLVLFHPHDATALDLLVHIVVVALVILLNRLAGGRLMGGSERLTHKRVE